MQKLATQYSTLSPMRRVLVAAATVGVFAAVLLLARMGGTGSMSLLFSGLDPAAAGEVIETLDQMGADYEVRGAAIYVETARRDSLRMALAAEGKPASGTKGYEILDGLSGFGTTSQMFDAAYWRAKEGELARTILSNPNIRAARVHISNPPARGFGARTPAAASVTVSAASGLSAPQARALRFLVASAVAGLDPETVSVIDSERGIVASTDNATMPGGEDRAEVLRRNVQRLIEARVGYGNAVVEVAVDTVTEREQITERTFDPDSRVAISVVTSETTASASDSRDGAVTVASNLPAGDAGASGADSTSTDSETREQVNYEVSEVQREVLRTPGAVKKLSVAVLVNGLRTVGEGRRGDLGAPARGGACRAPGTRGLGGRLRRVAGRQHHAALDGVSRCGRDRHRCRAALDLRRPRPRRDAPDPDRRPRRRGADPRPLRRAPGPCQRQPRAAGPGARPSRTGRQGGARHPADRRDRRGLHAADDGDGRLRSVAAGARQPWRGTRRAAAQAHRRPQGGRRGDPAGLDGEGDRAGMIDLEDFGSGAGDGASETPDDGAALREALRAAAYEEGYKSGWDDSARAAENEMRAVGEELARNLRDLGFTYFEARAELTEVMKGFLCELLDKLFPALLPEAAAATLVDEITALSGDALDGRMDLLVSPDDAETIRRLLDQAGIEGASLCEEPALASGQARLQASAAQVVIDADRLTRSLRDALRPTLTHEELACA